MNKKSALVFQRGTILILLSLAVIGSKARSDETLLYKSQIVKLGQKVEPSLSGPIISRIGANPTNKKLEPNTINPFIITEYEIYELSPATKAVSLDALESNQSLASDILPNRNGCGSASVLEEKASEVQNFPINSNSTSTPPRQSTQRVAGNLAQIINVGKSVWAVIEENRPSANLESQLGHALPVEEPCWHHLQNWHRPVSHSYAIRFKNRLGMALVSLDFRVRYSYGGSYRNKGQYLTNVAVIPTHLDVTFGQTLNAQVKILPVTNLGTTEDPLAGMEIQFHWEISNIVQTSLSSQSFFIDGAGNLEKQ